MRPRIFLPLLVGLVFSTGTLGRAQQNIPPVRLFDDLRISAWSKDFLIGKREEVLHSVEQDLRSPAPHPFAPHIWVSVQFYLGRLEQTWPNMRDPQLRNALGIWPDVYQLYFDGQYKQLLEKFPASRVNSFRDPWVLHYLFFAADAECRYDEALAYGTQMARLYPDYFQAGWMVSGNLVMNERIRPKIATLVSPRGEMAGTMVGRYLQDTLSHLPSTEVNEFYLAQINTWLKERPQDARAWRAKGFALRTLKRGDESLQAFLKANELYPFISQNYQDAATELIRQGKRQQAEEVITFNVKLRTPDEKSAVNRFDEQLAEALINSATNNEDDFSEKAIEFLKAALIRNPNNAELCHLLSRASSSRRSDYLYYARRAAYLEPDSFSRQEYLLEALMQVNLVNEALLRFREINQRFAQKSERLFWTASIALGQTLNLDEQIDLCNHALKEYPNSAWLHRVRSVALAGAGRFEEAKNDLIVSWEIEPPGDWSLKLMAQLVLPPSEFEEPKEVKKKHEKYGYEERRLREIDQWMMIPPPLNPRPQSTPEYEAEKKEIEANIKKYREEYEEAKSAFRKQFAEKIRAEIEKIVPTFAGRFPWVEIPEMTDMPLDEDDFKLAKRFLTLKNSVPAKFQSVPVSSIQRLKYDPALRAQLETFNDNGVHDFSPNDEQIISAGNNGTLLFWDIASGRVTLSITEHQKDIRSIRFSKSGEFFATASLDGTVKLWSTNSRSVIRSFQGFAGTAVAVTLDPASVKLFILSASYEGDWDRIGSYQLSCWEAESGNILWSTNHLYSDYSFVDRSGLRVSPDGKFVVVRDVSMGRFGSISFYETNRGQRAFGVDSEELAFRPDGKIATTIPEFNEGTVLRLDPGNQETYPVITTQQVIGTRGWRAIWLSPDGKKIVASDNTGKPVLIDAETGKTIKRWTIDSKGGLSHVLWNNDSATLLVQLNERQRTGNKETDVSVKASLLLLSTTGDTPIWKKETQLRTENEAENDYAERFKDEIPVVSYSSTPIGAEFSAAGRYLSSKGNLWDVVSGQIVARTGGTAGEFHFIPLSPDGHYLWAFHYSDYRESGYGAFDLQQGAMLPHRYINSSDNHGASIDAQNRLIYINLGTDEKPITGSFQAQGVNDDKPVATLGARGSSTHFALSRDGSVGLTVANGNVTAWDLGAQSIKSLWSLNTGEPVHAFAISPDKKHLATAATFSWTRDFKDSSDVAVNFKIWNVATQQVEKLFYEYRIKERSADKVQVTDQKGRVVTQEEYENQGVFEIKFSPDGKYVAGAMHGHDVRLNISSYGYPFEKRKIKVWDVATGTEVLDTAQHKNVNAFDFSPNSQFVVTVGHWQQAGLWRLSDGTLVREFPDTERATDVRFSPDGQSILIARESRDEGRRIEIWDPQIGQKRATLYLFTDNSWAVIDSQGRYDSSNSGDISKLYWVVGTDVIQVGQLKQRYYEPGLLAKLMGFNKDPVRNVAAFKEIKLYPAAQWKPPASGSSKAELTLTNRGGGIGEVKIFVNDREVIADARGPNSDPDQKELKREIDLQRFKRFMLPGQENRIEIVTYNTEGYLASRGTKVVYTPPPEEKPESPNLWAVVVGVSTYHKGGDLSDLSFAAKDAEAMATVFESTGEQLFPGRTKVTLLSSSSNKPEQKPTRENIVNALKDLATKAKSTDILLLYFAGHGVSYGGQDGDFYFLTSDASTGDLKDEGLRETTALSSEDLAQLVINIAANKQVMILDTCASGRLIQKLTETRSVDSSTIRAWERMKDRTGLWVFAGSAADAVSYESSRYGQGVLTYSLLKGMKVDFEKALRRAEGDPMPEFIDVATLFNYSADTVPELAQGVGGIQKPLIAAKRDARSFDIGRVTAKNRSLIPYTLEKPVYLRSNFQLAGRPRDTLELTNKVDAKLRETSARGLDAPLVFWDLSEQPGAYHVAGRYEIDGSKVSVQVFVSTFTQAGDRLEEKDIGQPFTIAGDMNNIERLIAEILSRTEKLIRDVKN